MNKVRSILAALVAASLVSLAQAQAVVPAEIELMTDNAEAVWTTVKAIVIGVVGFLILLRFVKLVTKR